MAVDRLITVLEAHDRFTPVARRVEQSAASLAHKLQALQHAGQPGLSGMTSPGVGNPLDLVTSFATRFNPVALALTAVTTVLFGAVAIGATYAGVLGLIAQQSIAAASSMQMLEATLTAVTGSAERATEKMRFLRRFATESVFEFQDLARAGTLLESFGLRMERLLPIIARLGAVFGANRELLDQLASAFGRIGAGQFGEAMEILRRFGISSQALSERGVEFTGGGQIVSNAETVLRAVESVVLARFGSITEQMSSTLVVQLSNLRDSVFQMFETVGRGLLPGIQIFVSELQRVLSALRESGTIQGIGLLFGQAALRIGTTLANMLPKLVAWFATLIEAGPKLFVAIWDSAREFMTRVVDAFQTFANTVMEVLVNVHNLIARLANSLSAALGPLGGRAIGSMSPIAFQPLAIGAGLSFAALMDRMSTRAGEIEALIRAGLQTGVEPTSAPTGEAAGAFWNRQQSLTEEIARNTRETRDLMREQIDFQRIILGGGERASLGVTPVERARLNRTEIQRGAESFIEQVVERMLRLRVIR